MNSLFCYLSIILIVAVMQPTALYGGSDVLLEDDKPVLPGLPIRAATLSALSRLVVNVFGKYSSCYSSFRVHSYELVM
jgi:hypothetical protein